MKHKKLNLLLTCLLSSIILTACGASSSYDSIESITTHTNKNSYDYGYSEDIAYLEMEESIDNIGKDKTDVSTNRKLVKKVYLDVETDSYDEYTTSLYQKINELGGYIENSSSHGNSITYSYKNGRYATYTIRIPQNKLNDFVSYVENGSNILTKEENVTDVTLEYVDLEARKKSLLTEETRLIELLEKAENLTDVIQLEDKLSSVRYEIDSIESSLRTFDSLVDYSTITLTVNEVERYTEIPTIQQTPIERMINGFVESINEIKDGFVNFCVDFVIAIPYLLIYAIIILLIILVIKLIIKKIKNKNKNKTQNLNTSMYSAYPQNNYNLKTNYTNNIQNKTTNQKEQENLDEIVKKI